MMTEKPLTSRQRTILEAILFLIGKGDLPTVREVGSLVGLRSPATVMKHVRVLEKASLISVSGKSRGIRISDPELLERVIQADFPDATRATDSPGATDPPRRSAQKSTVSPEFWVHSSASPPIP